MENCIEINNLTFSYKNQEIFKNLSLNIKNNSCYVLSGLNGTGKSTLLKVIGGKTLANYDSVKVLGKDPFRDTSSNYNISFINNEWGTRTVAFTGHDMPIHSSLKVKEMMKKLKDEYPDRNEELINVLGINTEWELNSISEGQRKRVQLYLGLIQPFKVCLLDEITVNLDILVKDRFMNYLKKESIQNNSCIIYVTHIFDGLEEWCTDLIYIKKNREIEFKNINEIPNKNIYQYLLENFKKEHQYNYNEEEEENKQQFCQKNAGGYSNGVLINMDYKFNCIDNNK